MTAAAVATHIAERARILCVDDEPLVLEAIARNLRRNFDVLTAGSGAEGLAILEKEPAISVVMSDMRMPVMTGAVFLARARAVCPDVVRILLTGQTDLDSAIAAVNDGGLFRFLTKPCPLATLRDAMTAALEQHRLMTSSACTTFHREPCGHR